MQVCISLAITKCQWLK